MAKNQIDFIVGEVAKPSGHKKLTILLTSTHPFTDSNICKTGHEFYNLNLSQFPIKWPADHPMPANMKIINSLDELPWRPDVILSQNIVDQYNIFKQISFSTDAPIVQFEHTVPTKQWQEMGMVKKLLLEAKPDMYGFITDFSRTEWLRKDDPCAFTVYHMVDTEYFKPSDVEKTKCAMVLANAFASRKWALGNIDVLLEKAMGKCQIDLFGHNPGYQSVPLGKSAVVQEINQHKIFINTSLRSPIPASLLEAASCGAVILSPATCAIPEFFTDKKDILYYNGEDECIALVQKIEKDYESYKYIGENARKTILEKFNETDYIAKWNDIFRRAINEYTRK